MIRYWFEFDFTDYDQIPFGVIMGCGVTGHNYDDVIGMLKERVFVDRELPAISKMVENIDIRELDQGHVIPNMSIPVVRGVWFPLGFQ